MSAEGITFVNNAEVGKNVDAQQILQDNDAVLLAVGSTCPRDIPLPGKFLLGSCWSTFRSYYKPVKRQEKVTSCLGDPYGGNVTMILPREAISPTVLSRVQLIFCQNFTSPGRGENNCRAWRRREETA